MVEKVHGRGMSQRVWAYVLPLEGTAFFFGDGDVFRQKAFDGIAAELSASDADKERIVGAAVAFAHPSSQHFCGLWPERRASMFSAFSLAVDMRTSSQHNVLASQADQFGDPKARLHGE